MPEELESAPHEHEHHEHEHEHGSGKTLIYVVTAVAVIYVAISAFLMADMRGRIDKLEVRAANAENASVELQKEVGKRLSATNAELKADTGALAGQIGMTQKQLSQKSAALQREQQETAARLSAEQKQGIAAVSGEVTGVKTDVGAVKTDVATTKTELEATKAKLDRTIGDLGLQSGLIAKTREDLEYLRHRGDRNYYEFTLAKSKKATPVGTVSLELKKTDPKKAKYTLNVMADDRTIEKKDRNVNEPVQFYSGKDRQLFELVVFGIEKDKVTGYLSAPKNVPAPVDVSKQ